MAANKRDPKGDRRTVGREQAQSSPTPPQGQNDLIQVDVALDERERELGCALNQFLAFDHGYLKVRRASLGSDTHLTWTWTLGSHAGTYVYVRVNFWEVAFGLKVLARKVFEVDEGRVRSTPDKRNPSQNTA